ncbi:hypothetical protein GJ654_12755 [Rhodoblastus acidophilus]|uniref:Uncharacterized protein n=1 Tax=Rhodoblastus acidophilus TaxID=1074 RepID=A0A6N8DPS4_RHOAC|nr:hypothetical protein [Rhodoblastus acidophilus]MCW2275691.1 hypothetical protein [Rhodoblastus acidophilus]MTV31856.1 hypothetical protein [Rhodoblastus acidophilus]
MQQATKERVLLWLKHDEDGAKRDLEGVRDLIRGTYRLDLNSGNFARLSRSLLAFNYMRLMGNFVAANFTEIYRPAMVHGLLPYLQDGLRPLIKNVTRVFSDERDHRGTMRRARKRTRHHQKPSWISLVARNRIRRDEISSKPCDANERVIRFPQDRFAIRENEIARKSFRRRADFRASGIRFPN